jgi:transcriptional regulator of aroF, aroG, tyrA and aromatic amino acid transport
MRQLLTYDWPGNVRELRNVIERAVHLTNSHVIQWTDFFPEQLDISRNVMPMEVIVHQMVNLEEAVSIAERALMEKVIKSCNSSRQMGEILGVSHTTVLNKLKKYNLV